MATETSGVQGVGRADGARPQAAAWRVRLLGVVAVLAIGIAVPGVRAAGPAPGPLGPPLTPSPSQDCLNEAFAIWIQQQAACKSLWCSRSLLYYALWFVEENCEEPHLSTCLDGAEEIFNAAKSQCIPG